MKILILKIFKYISVLLIFSLFSNISISRGQNENLTSDELLIKGEYFQQIKDYKHAMFFFIKSAEKNNPKAQHKIASFYEYGIGVEKDYIAASKWYTKSAKQGDIISQKKLERLTYLMKNDSSINGKNIKDYKLPYKENIYKPNIEIKHSVADNTNMNGDDLDTRAHSSATYLSHYLNGFIDIESIGEAPALQFAWSRMGAALTCNVLLDKKTILSNLAKVYSLNPTSIYGYISQDSNLYEIDPITFHHLESSKIAKFCNEERIAEIKKEVGKLENEFLPKKYYQNEGIVIPSNFRL